MLSLSTYRDHGARRAAPRVAVVGGGVLGVMTALLCAESDMDVTLLERADRLWGGASMNGEGKVHLGPIYAMGGTGTARVMLRGAMQFGSLAERAVGCAIDWHDLRTEEFTYLVMPDSLLDAHALAHAYGAINREYAHARSLFGGMYLGDDIRSVIDTRPGRDEVTGLPAFRTRERCVDPLRLGAVLVGAAEVHPRVDVVTGADVVGLDAERGTLQLRDRSGPEPFDRGFDAIVNCAWAGRARIEAAGGGHPPMQNIRVKASMRLTPQESDRAVTLVQGPYGDVVPHRDYTYASWYPVARVHHEEARQPSPAAARALVSAAGSDALPRDQMRALAALGLIDAKAQVLATAAGVVLGHGGVDIHHPDSGLHRRDDFGVRMAGCVVTPDNYKFTTAPLAADQVCRTIRDAVRGA
jgi:glycine/D-amino acid oxidase-like deaminating enzyme